MKKLSKAMGISIIGLTSLATIIILLFSNENKAIENDISVVENSVSNRMYIMGNDTELLNDYNLALLDRYDELQTEQEFIDSVKAVRVKTDLMGQMITTRYISKITVSPKQANKVKDSTKDEDKKYTEEDLMLLAKLIQGEAGSDFIENIHQQLVGCVVINRVNHDKFPNTIKEVIYQEGQYQCVKSKSFDDKPSQRAIDNAKLVLEGKVDCPSNVIFQAEFKQGKGTYKKIKTIISTTYFCHD